MTKNDFYKDKINQGDNIIVKIHYSAISTVCVRWVYYDRPCDLQIKRSAKNYEYIGICFKIENESCLYFLNAVLTDIKGSEFFVNYNNHEETFRCEKPETKSKDNQSNL